MTEELDLRAAPGFVDEELSAELPGLRLDWMTLPRGPRRSPPELVSRLEALSNRYRGASVIAMRTQPIPHAYRTFYRQLGLDPDVDRIPSEQAAVARLLHGGFRSYGALEDALLIALIETGVPVWALDADLIDPGGLGIRLNKAAGSALKLFSQSIPATLLTWTLLGVLTYLIAVDRGYAQPVRWGALRQGVAASLPGPAASRVADRP